MTHLVPHNDPRLADDSIAVAAAAMRASRLSEGSTTSAGVAVATFVGAAHAAITSSGTAALQAALIGTGLGLGSRVGVPTVTCPAVAHAIRAVGATLRLVDVGTDIPVLDPSMIDADELDAVVVPHMFGHRVDTAALVDLDLLVIEDAAQALAPTRSEGAATTVLSFSPTKLLTAGYSGAVATDDDVVADRIRRFLAPDDDASQTDDGESPLPFRINASLAGFQHELLRAELRRYDEVVAYRAEIASIYRSAITTCAHVPISVPYRHLVRLPSGVRSDDVVEDLAAAGIGAAVLGSHLLHRTLGIDGEFPNAERFRSDTVSLPMHLGVTHDDASRVAESLQKVCS